MMPSRINQIISLTCFTSKASLVVLLSLFFHFATAQKSEVAKSDTLESNVFNSEEIQNFLDWQSFFKWPDLMPTGQITNASLTAGYEYGFPSDFIIERPNHSNCYLRGNFTSDHLRIPLKFEGNYRQYSLHPETENYFRISFDQKAFAQKGEQQKSLILKTISDQRDFLNAEKQLLSQKFSALNSLSSENMQPKINGISHDSLYKSDFVTNTNLSQIQNQWELDSISNIELPIDTISEQLPSSKTFTKETKENFTNVSSDSLQSKKLFLQQEIFKIDKRRKSLDVYEKEISGRDYSFEQKVSKRNWRKAIQHVNALEIGQTNPKFSHFVVGPIAVNGINIAYTDNMRDLNFCHGQIVISSYSSLDQRQVWIKNLLQDAVPTFKNIGDRVTAMSTSIFKSKRASLHFSALYGLDKFLSDNPSLTSLENRSFVGRNVVTELSGQNQIGKSGNLEYSYARSIMNDPQPHNEGMNSNGWKSIQSGAAWMRYQTEFPNARLVFKLEGSRIESGFKSLGNPFLRNDQNRFDLSLKKKWNKGYFSITSRNLRNNVNGQSSRTCDLRSIIFQIQSKLTKTWQLTFLLAPAKNSFEDSDTKFSSSNQVYQEGITSIKTWRKRDFFSILMISGNRYDSRIEKSKILTSDATISWTLENLNKFKQMSTMKYTVTSGLDSVWSGKTLSSTEDIQIQIYKKISLQMGATYIIQSNSIGKAGYRSGLTFHIMKGMDANVIAEKVVLENFYSQAISNYYLSFPYRFSITINYIMS